MTDNKLYDGVIVSSENEDGDLDFFLCMDEDVRPIVPATEFHEKLGIKGDVELTPGNIARFYVLKPM